MRDRSVSPESVQHVRENIKSPKRSTRRLSRELILSKSTTYVLHYILKNKAYHIQVLYKLEDEDHAAQKLSWIITCHDLLEAVAEGNLMDSDNSSLWHQKTQLPDQGRGATQ